MTRDKAGSPEVEEEARRRCSPLLSEFAHDFTAMSSFRSARSPFPCIRQLSEKLGV